MQANTELLSWIILAPLLGAFVLGLIALAAAGKSQRPHEFWVGLIACAGPVIAAAITGILLMELCGHPEVIKHQSWFTWLETPWFALAFGLTLDRLTAIMAIMITGIGSLIHIFSLGYMHKDPGFSRYFAYLNLFLAAMLLLVLSDNLVGLFFGWEGVGVCSYLLIGFWFQDMRKSAAGTKAFIVNRVGDFGLLLGILFLFHYLGAFDFATLQQNIHRLDEGQVLCISLLLLLGAMGKSAQMPLHVWLPDAMAGPTPVSALIHAATMVTAGVYLLARMHFLFSLNETVSLIVVGIGALTALMAATVALVQEDIKKVLAYSTLSQLGYMFMGVGTGAYAAGIFHVFTHAFFKAALFLGAGAVIHALHHEQNLWKMGGLKKHLTVTWWVMGIATLAIAGIPPFAGFFSKDEILWSLWEKGYTSAWGVGLLTAGLTSFYMFRLFFLTFSGPARGEHHDIHSEPLSMKAPLLILGVGAATVGFLGVPHALGGHQLFGQWLEPLFGAHSADANHNTMALILMAVSVGAAALGWWVAQRFYLANSPARESLAERFLFIGAVFKAKWGFDELYQTILVYPLLAIGRLTQRVLEVQVIDGTLRGLVKGYGLLSQVSSMFQNGYVRAYGYYILLGLTVMIFYYCSLHSAGLF